MVAMKGTLGHTTPLFLATVRLLPAGLIVLAVAIALGRSQPRGWVSWAWLSLFALLDGSLFQGFLAEGLARTSAGLGSVMIDSQPLAVALMARYWFNELIGPWGWLGLAVGLGGISLIGLPDAWIIQGLTQLSHTLHQFPIPHSLPQLLNSAHPSLSQPTLSEQLHPWLQTPWLQAPWLQTLSHPNLWPHSLAIPIGSLFSNGEWLMLLASLSMASGTIVSRITSRHIDPIMATGWHLILGSIPVGVLSWGLEQNQWQQLTWSDGLALGYATLFGSAIAYGLFFYFAAQGSLTSLSALTFLTPVFALLFGHWFLHENLSRIQWVGVALTLISIYIINQRDHIGSPSQPNPTPQPAPPIAKVN